MKENLKKAEKKVMAIVRMAYFFAINAVTALASSIEGSNLVTGSKALIEDVSGVLLWAIPVTAAFLIAYFSLRKSAAEDEQDGKAWTKRIKTTIVCLILGVTGSGLINVIVNYYH